MDSYLELVNKITITSHNEDTGNSLHTAPAFQYRLL